MYEYYCTTKQGRWKFYADNDIDAVRHYSTAGVMARTS